MRLSRLFNYVLAIAVSTGLMAAKTIRVPNDQPNLQAAHDAAAAGDTIVITVDTPGALISKRLTIQGTGGVAISAAVGTGNATGFGTFGGATYGIGLTSGASGSLIRNVTIDTSSVGLRPQIGIVTGGSFGSAAKDVTVRQSNIVETFQGVSGRCVGTGTTASCPTGWTVAQNDISLNSEPVVYPSVGIGAYIGIIAFNGADNWTIIHNEVTRPKTPAPAFTDLCFSGIAGIEVLSTTSPAYQPSPVSISGVGVKQNHVAVQGDCTVVPAVTGSCGSSVIVFPGCGTSVAVVSEGTNALTTVGYNDLRGSNFATLVYSTADPSTTSSGACVPAGSSDDLTGLHQYGYSADTGSVTCLTSLGNMDDWGNGNRGSTSNSAVRPGTILPK